MSGRRGKGVRALLVGLVAGLGLTGCTGVGVAEAPATGPGTYQVWGLNEASSSLTGGEGSVVLNGDLERGGEPFFTVRGTWEDSGLVLDQTSTERVRQLAGALPERTGDPECERLVLVDEGMLTDSAVAVVDPATVGVAGGPLVATRLR